MEIFVFPAGPPMDQPVIQRGPNIALLVQSKLLLHNKKAYQVCSYGGIWWVTAVSYMLRGSIFGLLLQEKLPLWKIVRIQRFWKRVLQAREIIAMCLHPRVAKGSHFERIPIEIMRLILTQTSNHK